MTLEVTPEPAEHALVLRLVGSVDRLTADSLLAATQSHLAAGHVRLVADFSGVEYTSSAGLRALLATLKEARQRGGDFRLAAVRPEVHRVLALSGFTSILKIYDAVGAADESFAR